METGYSLLKGKLIDEKTDIKLIESSLGFSLPPLYKLFIETFYVGEKNLFTEKVFISSLGYFRDLSYYYFLHNGETIGFSYFINIEKAIEVYSSNYLTDYHYERNYFPFAVSDGGGLCVGTKDEEIDKIVWDDPYGGYQVIANNVFEFIRGIKVDFLEEENLYGGIKYSQLYKNYGEYFYRVRE